MERRLDRTELFEEQPAGDGAVVFRYPSREGRRDGAIGLFAGFLILLSPLALLRAFDDWSRMIAAVHPVFLVFLALALFGSVQILRSIQKVWQRMEIVVRTGEGTLEWFLRTPFGRRQEGKPVADLSRIDVLKSGSGEAATTSVVLVFADGEGWGLGVSRDWDAAFQLAQRAAGHTGARLNCVSGL